LNAEDTKIEVNQSEQVQPNLTANFAYERDLQTTLCAQIAGLFPNHKIYGESNLGIEFSIAGKRIDVLLEHTESKDLLIVELKSGRADDKVFGQISMYLGLAIREFPERSIKGVIVAGNIDDSLRYACETNSEITVKLYRMSLELEDAG
jgi:RecB family endonuclease NucS